MTGGFSRSPSFLKGALLYFSGDTPVPKVIVFQYNPEKMTRKFDLGNAKGDKGEGDSASSCNSARRPVDPLSQPRDPEEKFTVELLFDATDQLEDPDNHPVERASGVASRVSQIEMLLYPSAEGVGDKLMSTIKDTLAGIGVEVIERKQVPVVLFFWGPGRVLPVRITGFEVAEEKYSTTLYPVRAKVKVDMTVLREVDLEKLGDSDSIRWAIGAYRFTRTQKQTPEVGEVVGKITETIMNMLPF